tara:strand:+ start:76 stop:999 length:924 start_codon:yes stop_codon:yes gene_type:complete
MVRNSKILVAGGSGFIGANLIKVLISSGNKVISISKNKNVKNRKIEGVKYIYHDLRKPLSEEKYTLLSDIKYVVNCSGYIDHTDFSNGGKIIFNDHFESIINLTNIAMNLKVNSFIHIGSSDEYGENNSPISESARESPISPYALAKLTSTHYLQLCYRQKILNTIVIRPFLVFGEGQNKNRFLPYLIDNCINNREFKVTKGAQIRDYLYVKDFNLALLKAFNNEKAFGEVINIASGIPISIKEIIECVKEITGKGKPNYGAIDYRPGESMRLYADITKAKEILKWEPKFNFKNSLKKVINWYKYNE